MLSYSVLYIKRRALICIVFFVVLLVYISDLVQFENELFDDIKSIDSELQMIIYENYGKFIAATDTIHNMKTTVELMEVLNGVQYFFSFIVLMELYDVVYDLILKIASFSCKLLQSQLCELTEHTNALQHFHEELHGNLETNQARLHRLVGYCKKFAFSIRIQFI